MSRQAWDRFWAVEHPAGGGCLAERTPSLEAAQRHFWRKFARTLPRGAHVLDLATGDGVVMGWLIAARGDLRPFGIDLARHVPKPPKGCRVRGGIAMEALPLADESQDAVVSQFGVEYGNLPRVVSELTRVLKVGGQAALMTHRSDSPILEHNQLRRLGLEWALAEARLIEKARAGMALAKIGVAVPPAIAAAPAVASARFGAGSAAWEFAEAVAQSLALDEPQAARLARLATLEEKARDEISRINSLEAASQAVSDRAAVEQLFADGGLILESSEPLRETTGRRAFADIWLLRKAAAQHALG